MNSPTFNNILSGTPITALVVDNSSPGAIGIIIQEENLLGTPIIPAVINGK